jgi:hypothetical protein
MAPVQHSSNAFYGQTASAREDEEPAAATFERERKPPCVQTRQRNPSSFGSNSQPRPVGIGPDRASIGSGSRCCSFRTSRLGPQRGHRREKQSASGFRPISSLASRSARSTLPSRLSAGRRQCARRRCPYTRERDIPVSPPWASRGVYASEVRKTATPVPTEVGECGSPRRRRWRKTLGALRG